jgi:TolB-like protein
MRNKIFNFRRFFFIFVLLMMFLLSDSPFLLAYEKEIKSLSSTMAENIVKAGKKTIAVVDFVDLQGNVTELGRFLAEEFSVALAGGGKGFEVVDRTHLKTLLKEHKLAETGVIDPSTAKKLGQIAGVDALVTGTITPLSDSVRLSVKILDTATAKVIGASSCDIAMTKAIEKLLGKGIETETERKTSFSTTKALMSVEEKAFLFEIQSCKLFGQTITCSLLVTNKGNDRELHINAECDACYDLNTRIFDDSGNEYRWSDLQIGNKRGDKQVKNLLVSGIPTKMVISFARVPERLNRVSLLDIGCHSKGGFRVQFHNVPLNR